MDSSPRTIATAIVRRLHAAGYAAFWVGGCVRDFLLGREPQDYDIATNALPEAVEKLFPHTVPVGKKFGVLIVVEGGHNFQVATFRAESDYQDGRRPEKVAFGDAEADASRRDFTVNGLFYDPLTEKLHDWVGGEKDLRAKILRTIGAPEERFGEDHLRLLRAVRFAAQLGFAIEPQTFAAVQKLAPKIKLIAAERVRDELIKLFAPPMVETPALTPALSPGERGNAPVALANPLASISSQRGNEKLPLLGERVGVRAEQTSHYSSAARGLDLLRDSALLEHILPELAATSTCEQSPDFHPEGSVFNHLRLMFRLLPPDAHPSLPWAVLLHDIAKPVTFKRDVATGKISFHGHESVGARMAGEILERLRFPRKQIDEIVACVRHHMQFKDAPLMRKATLRRMLLRETFPLELELHRLDSLGSNGRLDKYNFLVEQAAELARQPQLGPPLLTGEDLIALGVKPGPRLGLLLADIRERQLADELKTAEQARHWVRKKITVPPA